MARATRLQLGRAAYRAYGEATGGLNVRGEQLPDWDDLGGVVQHAWLCAAQEVEQMLSTPQAPAPGPDTD
ncbi:hypothetical protein C5F59_027475 [Streptomyces sp. QL37]|uniref:hypothetical protein n=1 Tax=Streptomyces sp. QL37 TaxID=2093747 RepID=UPI000CF20D40|nr:hypothetical protein [Streptomyces sp. QL37]PPQ57144.1 hypothetical protein C5F59_10955 [Streptomyces sp. QL37]